jgi:peptidoglycan hydrolase-like protein with peptidoglycan-binding domain
MGPLVKPWPAETPLSLSDRMTAQRALAAEGFDPGAADGLIGTRTRAALRAWQAARGLTADGYLSMAEIEQLKAEAQAPASPGAAAPAGSSAASPPPGAETAGSLSPPRPTSPAPR